MLKKIDCNYSDAMTIATEKANSESPHLVVPFYMPLAKPMSLAKALNCCRPEVKTLVETDEVQMLGVAHGTMVAPGDEERTVQFILLFGSLADGDPDTYWLFDTFDDEYDLAVLMNGDGSRFMDERVLTQEEAISLWMGGFLGWNEKVPGLYRLRYALIQPGE